MIKIEPNAEFSGSRKNLRIRIWQYTHVPALVETGMDFGTWDSEWMPVEHPDVVKALAQLSDADRTALADNLSKYLSRIVDQAGKLLTILNPAAQLNPPALPVASHEVYARTARAVLGLLQQAMVDTSKHEAMASVLLDLRALRHLLGIDISMPDNSANVTDTAILRAWTALMPEQRAVGVKRVLSMLPNKQD